MQASATDAITLLKTDHRKVEQLFEQFRAMRDAEPDDRWQIVRTVCRELSVHAMVEEEIFYPAVRKASGREDLVGHAEAEHDQARKLIGRLEQMNADDAELDAIFLRLAEVVREHVREEESALMPAAEGAPGLSMTTLGVQLEQRKEDLENTLDEQARALAAHSTHR